MPFWVSRGLKRGVLVTGQGWAWYETHAHRSHGKTEAWLEALKAGCVFGHVHCVLFRFFFLMAVLGLRFCARAFSSCGKRGPLFIAVRRPLTIAASPVAEHRLQMRRLSNCGSRA